MRIDRREFLGKAMALGAGVLAAGCYYGKTRKVAPRPNIIHILADDLGWGDVGFLGQQRIRTPHIDRLAAEGMRFTQHYAGAPICAPSRYTLMCGRHTGHYLAMGNNPHPYADPTVAQLLKQAGYTTHFAGKWGLGGADYADDPHMDTLKLFPRGESKLLQDEAHLIPSLRGFDTSLAFLNQAYAHFHYPIGLWRDGRFEQIPHNQTPNYDQREGYAQDLFEQEVLDHLDNADGKQPLYIQASFTLPHRETTLPPGPDPYAKEDWPKVEKAFAGMVTRLDTSVGRIVEAVDANPALVGNTLIFFTSDNGPQYTDGHTPFYFDSNGPWRGNKRDLYEGGLRMPTVARWSGHIAPGTQCNLMTAFWDFLPTCMELAGQQPPKEIDGISFAPSLTGEGNQRQHEFLYWEYSEQASGPATDGGYEPLARQALRRGPWKYLRFKDGTRELYNLDHDPGETHNLASKRPELLRQLEQQALSQASSYLREMLQNGQ